MPSPFKYWIGADGIVRIRKGDMPKPVIFESVPAPAPEIGLRMQLRSNPLFSQFRAELKALTGSEKIIVLPDEPGQLGV